MPLRRIVLAMLCAALAPAGEVKLPAGSQARQAPAPRLALPPQAIVGGVQADAGASPPASPLEEARALAPVSESGQDEKNPPDAESRASTIFDGEKDAPRAVRAPTLSDRFHYAKHYTRQLWWYNITHINLLWPRKTRKDAKDGYRDQILKARAEGELPVSSHRGFFSSMRVLGITGRFYILGFASRDPESVLIEARNAFVKHFVHPSLGLEEKGAFENFLQRAIGYNAARRNGSNLRKNVRDAMLQAAVTPVTRLAAFFDSLFPASSAQVTERFQKEGGQERVLARFRQAVLDTIAEEPPTAQDRVIAVVLLGSFASGGATPTSDLDVEVYSANGRSGRVAGFDSRLHARWDLLDGGGQNPNRVDVKEMASPASRALADMVYPHPYLVLSPDAGLVERMQRKPTEPAPFSQRQDPWRFNALSRAAQVAVVYATTVHADAVSRLKRLRAR